MIELKLAIQHNNAGILSLRSKNFESAVSHFKAALSLLEDSVAPLVFSGAEPMQLHHPLDTSATRNIPRLSSWRHVAIPTFDEDAFYILNYAIEISQDIDCLPSSTCDFSFYSSSITFNLGLACHQRGKNENNIVCLRRAGRFYEIVRNTAAAYVAIDSDFFNPLLVAALNNISQILFALSDFQSAQRALGDLIAVLSCSKSTEEDAAPAISREDTREVVLNAIMFRLRPCAPCA